ncbi:MAG: putative LacI-family transcriptional regulator [uncultured Cytophagales bacterium]|uniref:Putative LacI-family transcriptional regulator n=1 Tax=uncultured Cytophagales bacterium TaxID=158755 RepID=A0A6J4K481_9SPHI|nr:MAG: putative LacI-family transcriptional regulator [uncultured Cytophagales bacterium]
MVRIKDIALKANVSVGTVDRVLHNRGRVAEDVRQRVLQIAEELQYEPNLIARTLGSNRAYRVAALVPDPGRDPYWQQPRIGMEKAEKELRRYGVRVEPFVFNQYEVGSFLEQAAALAENPPDGILVAPLFYRESLPLFEAWQRQAIPFVAFNTQIPESQPLSYIGQDSYGSGFLAGKLLHYGQPGPATFLVAHIAEDFTNSAHLIRKEQGFLSYFEQHDPTGQYTVIHADLAVDTVQRQLDALLWQHPGIGGIFVTTSKAYVLAPLLPRRIRLVGYDLLPENQRYLRDGAIDFLINQNPQGQGYWGIVRLADHLVFRQPVAPLYHLPLDIVTKENLQYYLV